MLLREATIQDVDQMHALIELYAKKEIVLPRTKESLYEMIRSYTVAEENGQVIGLAGLHVLAADLAEIRTLVVSPKAQGKGVGKQLVTRLVDEAKKIGIRRVFALTYQVDFFERCGFKVVEKEVFPQKVWTDCIHCPKFHCCDEIAVLKRLDP